MMNRRCPQFRRPVGNESSVILEALMEEPGKAGLLDDMERARPAGSAVNAVTADFLGSKSAAACAQDCRFPSFSPIADARSRSGCAAARSPCF
jgi:hypothetical protein